MSDPAKDKAERVKTLSDEVASLNKSFSGWTFVLPNYKFGSFDKSMDDMLKPIEKKPDAKDAKAPVKPAAKPAPKPEPAAKS